jgi:hypothetical protein
MTAKVRELMVHPQNVLYMDQGRGPLVDHCSGYFVTG